MSSCLTPPALLLAQFWGKACSVRAEERCPITAIGGIPPQPRGTFPQHFTAIGTTTASRRTSTDAEVLADYRQARPPRPILLSAEREYPPAPPGTAGSSSHSSGTPRTRPLLSAQPARHAAHHARTPRHAIDPGQEHDDGVQGPTAAAAATAATAATDTSDDGPEEKWVECDDCKKWRRVSDSQSLRNLNRAPSGR